MTNNIYAKLQAIQNAREARRDKNFLYDTDSRIAFGKYEFVKFSKVPFDYLIWVRQNVDLTKYPYLRRYLAEMKEPLDRFERDE